MVKITFELSEDFIRENASSESASDKIKEADGNNAIRVMFDMIGFRLIEEQIKKGKTEFVVTPDKLDGKSQIIYNSDIAEICMLAAFSATDKKDEK